ncbi:MAG: carbohydrate binding domain-containing protein, partial [Rikenellaceae bacterium]
YMDAYSIHIYDGINVVGEDTRRSGSNAEAVLDLVESYQYAAFGSKKPFVISEYGGIDSETSGLAYQDPGSNRTVGSLNHILFTLLEREDNLLHSIPFICDKSTWYITEANNYGSYGAVLMIPTTIPTSSVLTGLQWQYTPKVYFYELWKGVTGNRFDITTTNPDIQSIGFRDGSTIYIALDNLEDEAETVSLLNSATESTLSNIEIRRCESNYDQGILFSVEYPGTLPESITMQKDEAIIIKATLGGESTTSNAIRRNRYYSTSNLQAITASSTITYKFSGVPTTTYGRATARMSIGRDLSASKNPTFYVNGTQVSVPTDWKGYDQEPRGTTFFGMIEVPFSTSLLNESGEQTITMKFSDGGGYVSSVILDVEAYDYRPTSDLGSLSNGDFESGKISWTPFSKGGEATIVSGDAARSGAYAGKVAGEAALAQRIVFSADQQYKISAWVKSSADSGQVTLATSNGDKKTFSTTKEYTFIEYSFNTVSEETDVIVRFENNDGDDTIYIDDVVFTVE